MSTPVLHLHASDDDMRASLTRYLQRYGWVVEPCPDPIPATAALVLAAWLIPDGDVVEPVARWRAQTDAALLVLLGDVGATQRVLALQAGADDCLSLPFEPSELVARLLALQRRARRRQPPAPEPVWRFGAWRFEPGSRRLLRDGGPAQALTPTEARLLELLLQSPRRVCRRVDLQARLRDPEAAASNRPDRQVDLLVSRLRQRLGDEAPAAGRAAIRTVRGLGYVLDLPVQRL